jgi:hypothetical protein
MKGGVGASYNPNCDLDVIKRIPSIKVRWYDLKKSKCTLPLSNHMISFVNS